MKNTNENIIASIALELEMEFTGEGSGHDWWHIYRVWKNAKHLAKKEKADLFTVELGALLHDIADWKFHDGDEEIGPRKAREMMEKYSVDENIITHVCNIILHMGFKGGIDNKPMETIEGKVVQDADRLDGIGAVGVARAFAYGGSKGRPLHTPDLPPEEFTSKEAYLNSEGGTINHFYEKLLKLTDLMNTKSAKKIAKKRHKYLEEFLDRFYAEWEGKK